MSDMPRLASVLLASGQTRTSEDDACSTANLGPRVPQQKPAAAVPEAVRPPMRQLPRLGLAWMVMIGLVALTSLVALGGMAGH